LEAAGFLAAVGEAKRTGADRSLLLKEIGVGTEICCGNTEGLAVTQPPSI